MGNWSTQDLAAIDGAEEIGLASRRPDGTLRPFVTMWMVAVDGELYVRSAYGPDNPWYRRAVTSGEGRIRAAGIEADVSFEKAAPDAAAAIDARYHAKYDRYGPKIVGTVVGEQAAGVTLRLVPVGPTD
jgi:hypothetical protein